MASSEGISKAMEQVFVFKTTNAFVFACAGMAQACALSGFLMALLKGNTDSSTLQYLCTVSEQILLPKKSYPARYLFYFFACYYLINPHFLLQSAACFVKMLDMWVNIC